MVHVKDVGAGHNQIYTDSRATKVHSLCRVGCVSADAKTSCGMPYFSSANTVEK